MPERSARPLLRGAFRMTPLHSAPNRFGWLALFVVMAARLPAQAVVAPVPGAPAPAAAAATAGATSGTVPGAPTPGQTAATDSPRERGRVLQKRNPLASEYQAPGTLGRSAGAFSDGEGSDYRAFFARTGGLARTGDLTQAGTFLTLQSTRGSPELGGDVRVRRTSALPAPGVGASGAPLSWAWDVRANVTAAERFIEHYEAAWSEWLPAGGDGRLDRTAEPLRDAAGDVIYFLERPRLSQDAIATRTRTVVSHAEVRLPGEHLLFAQAAWSDFSDDYFRHRIELNHGTGLAPADGGEIAPGSASVSAGEFADASARRYFARTLTEREILRFHGGGRSPLLGGRLDYGVYHARWHDTPTSDAWNFYDRGLDLRYRIDEAAFPVLQVTGANELSELARSGFNDLRVSTSSTLDLDWAGRVDFERPWTWQGASGWLTAGMLHRQKEREAEMHRDVVLRTTTPLTLAALSGTAPGGIMQDRYSLPLGLDAAAGHALYVAGSPALGFSAPKSALESFQETYASREEVRGGYLSVLGHRGPWELEAGLRLERTQTATRGIVTAPAGGTPIGPELAQITDGATTYSVQEARRENAYSSTLPTVSASWRLRPGLALRAAGYEQLMRPQYFDIVDYRRIHEPTRTASTGNPDLRPTSIRTATVALESDGSPLGLWAVELYATDVRDFFYSAQDFELIDGELYTVSRVANGSTAQLRGFQLQWSRGWRPGGAFTLETSAAYTWSDSEARLPTRPGDIVPLPERSRHLVSGELAWTLGRWSGLWQVAAQSPALDDVGPSYARDTYRDRVFSLDGSLTWRPAEGWRVTLRGDNLTNAPDRSYQGERIRVLRNQYGGTQWRLGVERTW